MPRVLGLERPLQRSKRYGYIWKSLREKRPFLHSVSTIGMHKGSICFMLLTFAPIGSDHRTRFVR